MFDLNKMKLEIYERLASIDDWKSLAEIYIKIMEINGINYQQIREKILSVKNKL